MPDMVTITGCLEVSTSGDTFRLTDTEGVDAPKSRSWRSGFFKKRGACDDCRAFRPACSDEECRETRRRHGEACEPRS